MDRYVTELTGLWGSWYGSGGVGPGLSAGGISKGYLNQNPSFFPFIDLSQRLCGQMMLNGLIRPYRKSPHRVLAWIRRM